MAFPPEHELHRRRFGRNMGLGLSLIALAAIIFGLTFVKVTVEAPDIGRMPAAAVGSVSDGVATP